jgi:hypothetical protein
MAVTFVSSSSAFTDVAPSIVIPTPAGLQVGDVLVYTAIAGFGAGLPIIPVVPLFLPVSQQQDLINDGNMLVAYRIADAADVAAPNITFMRGGFGTGAFAGILSAYRGVNPAAPIQVFKIGDGFLPGLFSIWSALPNYTVWQIATANPDAMVVYAVSGVDPAPGAPTLVAPNVPSALPSTIVPVTSAVAARSVLQGYHPMPVVGTSPNWTGGSTSHAFMFGTTLVLAPIPGTPPSDIEVEDTDVIASDMISITFNKDAKNNDLLRDPANYAVTPLGAGQPVNVRSVQTGNEIRTDFITLEVTPFTVGEEYLVTVSNIVGADAAALSPTENTAEFVGRLTKTDDAIRYRENIYGRDVNSIVRNILTAISLEDDKIGGSRR